MNDHNQHKRRPQGKEGAGGHQEGKNSVQAGQTQRREKLAPEQAPETGRSNKPSKRQGNK